ncbi:MAG: hypothetical protein ACLQVF_25870, partial [Isosphaeraceae bacterium]
MQQGDRQVRFVQEPRGGSYPPQIGLFNGRAGDLAQVREELVSAADRVGAGVYPESQHVDINARGPAGGWRTLAFQQAEGAAYGLATGGQSGLVGDGGCTPERVPGEGRLVTRCLFGDGDERRERGRAPTRPGQRPSGVVAGGHAQSGVRCDRQGPGGEILHPVPLAGGNRGRRGRYQPACLVLGVGAKFGRAFQRQRGGGRAAA